MRIYEITQQDPVFGDPTLMATLALYLSKDTIHALYMQSPYTPGSGNERWRNKYDQIVSSVKPELKKDDPNIDWVVKTIDKQIPIIGMPNWIQKLILQADKRYKDSKDYSVKNPTWGIVD
jgi:hypothetical protein